MKKVNISTVKEGAIVHFSNSLYEYMRVYDRNGNGGVVRLGEGEYIPIMELKMHGLDTMCIVAYDDLDELYFSNN